MDQRELITARSLELFKKYGTRSVTMDDLSRELGISKKTLYEHFDNKSMLVEAVLNYQLQLDDIEVDRITRNAANAVEEMAALSVYHCMLIKKVSPVALFDLVKYHRHVYEKLMNNRQERDYRHMIRNIERGKSEGLYRNDLDDRTAALLFMSMMISTIANRIVPAEMIQNGRIFYGIVDFYMHAICTSAGLQLWQHYQNTITL